MFTEIDKLILAVTSAVKNSSERELEELTREFNTPIQNLVNTQWVTSNCSDIIFINYTPLGTANGNIQVNNYVLQPGGIFGVSGNNAEINRDTYNVVFDTGATNCVVIKKLYTRR